MVALGSRKPNTTFDGYPARAYTRSSDNMGQIIYGPENTIAGGPGHGHISYDPDSGSVDYWREPGQDHDTEWNINGRDPDHTRI